MITPKRPLLHGCSLLPGLANLQVEREQEAFIGNQAGGRVFLFLRTDDFDRDYEAFRARGVRFVRPPAEHPYGKVAVFEDIYGNLWDLIGPPTR